MTETIIDKLVMGLKLLGDAVVAIITGIFATFGIQVPEALARIVLVLTSILLIYRFVKVLPKALIIIAIILIIAVLAGLI